jgi:hypothetical protein
MVIVVVTYAPLEDNRSGANKTDRLLRRRPFHRRRRRHITRARERPKENTQDYTEKIISIFQRSKRAGVDPAISGSGDSDDDTGLPRTDEE